MNINYKKKIKNNYNLHLVNTNRFKTISINLFFTGKFNKNNIEYYNMLSSVLLYSTKKYNTKLKYLNKLEELYNANVYSKYTALSGYETFTITLCMINPKYTSYDIANETFNFINEVINNPLVSNNAFDEFTFNYNKSSILSSIDISNDKSKVVAMNNFKKIFYKGSAQEYNMVGYKENYDKITPSSLYEFYKKLFTDYQIDVVVVGDNYDEIEENVDTLLKDFTSVNVGKPLTYKSKNKTLTVKSSTFKSNQSSLLMGYDFKSLSYYEYRYVLAIYNAMLGAMSNSVLFTNVREKYSLCYNVRSTYTTYFPAIVVSAGIDKDNYDKAIKAVNESLDILKNKETINTLLSSAKKSIDIFINNIYDDSFALADQYYFKEFFNTPDIEERRKIYSSVTPEDIETLGKKMDLKVIYFLKGEK